MWCHKRVVALTSCAAAPLITSLQFENSPRARPQQVRTEPPVDFTKKPALLSSLEHSCLSSFHKHPRKLFPCEGNGYCLKLRIPEWRLQEFLLSTPSLQSNPQLRLTPFSITALTEVLGSTSFPTGKHRASDT